MVRTYKRKKAPIDKEKLKAAVISVLRDKMSLRKSAELHGVKWNTLNDWVKKTSEESDL